MKLNLALFTPVILSSLAAVATPAKLLPRVTCPAGQIGLCCRQLVSGFDPTLQLVLEALGVKTQEPTLNIGVICDPSGPGDSCPAGRQAACCGSTIFIPGPITFLGTAGLNCRAA
ncbi:hypothetical protein PM082_009730 [Marasmius tenuissimus]|nr:hypothetical protein PM082_009730 [Marasmius tenuissimus]